MILSDYTETAEHLNKFCEHMERHVQKRQRVQTPVFERFVGTGSLADEGAPVSIAWIDVFNGPPAGFYWSVRRLGIFGPSSTGIQFGFVLVSRLWKSQGGTSVVNAGSGYGSSSAYVRGTAQIDAMIGAGTLTVNFPVFASFKRNELIVPAEHTLHVFIGTGSQVPAGTQYTMNGLAEQIQEGDSMEGYLL